MGPVSILDAVCAETEALGLSCGTFALSPRVVSLCGVASVLRQRMLKPFAEVVTLFTFPLELWSYGALLHNCPLSL